MADGSLSRNSQQYKGNKQSLTTPVLVVMHPLQDAESMGLGSNTGLSHGKKANTTQFWFLRTEESYFLLLRDIRPPLRVSISQGASHRRENPSLAHYYCTHAPAEYEPRAGLRNASRDFGLIREYGVLGLGSR